MNRYAADFSFLVNTCAKTLVFFLHVMLPGATVDGDRPTDWLASRLVNAMNQM